MLLLATGDSPNWAEAVSAVCAVVTVLAIGLAIWTINEAKYANANGWILELDKMFLEKHRLRAAFFNPNGKFSEEDAELAALIEYAADTWDFFLRHRFGVGTGLGRFRQDAAPEPAGIDGLQLSWQSEVFRWFNTSGPFRDYLESRSTTYRTDDSALGRLFTEWKRHHGSAQSIPPLPP